MQSKTVLMLVIVLLLFTTTSVLCEKDPEKQVDHDLQKLLSWMTGSFNSGAQAEKDSSFYNINLEMIQIWPGREDGYWLYVEQAVFDNRDKPYRQRVYHLHREDTTLVSSVYTFGDPDPFIGAHENTAIFATVDPADLIIREGCSIYLHPVGDTAFTGSTRESECQSSLRGAAYATSEVVITKARLVSWDRGFDSTGTQVWGARTGGYIFEKVSPLNPKKR